MKKVNFLSLVGLISIVFAHAGWAAGHEGVFGSSGGFGAGTAQAEVEADREAQWVAAEAEWAPADLSPVVAPLTIIAEACITGTRASDRCVLRFINHPL